MFRYVFRFRNAFALRSDMRSDMRSHCILTIIPSVIPRNPQVGTTITQSNTAVNRKRCSIMRSMAVDFTKKTLGFFSKVRPLAGALLKVINPGFPGFFYVFIHARPRSTTPDTLSRSIRRSIFAARSMFGFFPGLFRFFGFDRLFPVLIGDLEIVILGNS